MIMIAKLWFCRFPLELLWKLSAECLAMQNHKVRLVKLVCEILIAIFRQASYPSTFICNKDRFFF